MFGRKNPEEILQDKQISYDKELTRERNAYSMLDPKEDPYLIPRENTQDLTRWQQDLDNEVDMLMHDLRNEIKTAGGYVSASQVVMMNGVLKRVNIKPMINDEGLYRLVNLVKRYLTRNVMMSNFSEEIICRIMKGLVTEVAIHLAFNWERYEIDYTDLSIIMKMIKDSVEPTLYRSLNNGERNYLNTINKRIEAMNISSSQEKQGMFSNLFRQERK